MVTLNVSGSLTPLRNGSEGNKPPGYGYEYRSRATLFGLPLVHISFRYTADRRPVVACGVVAIGQFAVGGLVISQFGAGLLCISQFALGLGVISQFAVAAALIGQFGVYGVRGIGQFVVGLPSLL